MPFCLQTPFAKFLQNFLSASALKKRDCDIQPLM